MVEHKRDGLKKLPGGDLVSAPAARTPPPPIAGAEPLPTERDRLVDHLLSGTTLPIVGNNSTTIEGPAPHGRAQ